MLLGSPATGAGCCWGGELVDSPAGLVGWPGPEPCVLPLELLPLDDWPPEPLSVTVEPSCCTVPGCGWAV